MFATDRFNYKPLILNLIPALTRKPDSHTELPGTTVSNNNTGAGSIIPC